MSPVNADFPATHWTLIAAASGPERDVALSRLYKSYWKPLCAQARRFGVPADEVEDVAQELFVSFVQSDMIARADPLLGRFRSYLLGALRHHLSHRRRHDLTQKRGGGQAALPLDAPELAQTLAEAAGEWEFDAEWARALLDEALRRFQREAQTGDESRASFALIGSVALGDDERPYADAAAQLGITVAAVKSRVFRLRQRFRQIVREEVLRTVASETQCDDEMRYLGAVLEKVEGGPCFPLAA